MSETWPKTCHDPAFPSPRRGICTSQAGTVAPVWESQAIWLQPLCSKGENWPGSPGACRRNSVWWPKSSPSAEVQHRWQHLSCWHCLLQQPQTFRSSFVAPWGLAHQAGYKCDCIQGCVSVDTLSILPHVLQILLLCFNQKKNS